MPHSVVDLDGWLHVLDEDRDWSEPRITRFWYPIGLRTRDFVYNWRRELPISVEYRREGRYVDETGLVFELEHRGSTKATKVEYEPIPPPKRVRSPMEYREGAWWKLTKKGWTLA